jgi:hypothetical protein
MPPARRQQAYGARPHTVARGEDFRTISQMYYGSALYDQALWWANRGTVLRPETLRPGDVILIPPIDQLDSSSISHPKRRRFSWFRGRKGGISE